MSMKKAAHGGVRGRREASAGTGCYKQRSSDQPNLDPPVLLPPYRIVRAVRPRVPRDRMHLAPAFGVDRGGFHDVSLDEPALDRMRALVGQHAVVTGVADCVRVALDGERARRSLLDQGRSLLERDLGLRPDVVTVEGEQGITGKTNDVRFVLRWQGRAGRRRLDNRYVKIGHRLC